MRTIDYISYQQKSLLPYPASCLENSGRDNLRSNHDTGSIGIVIGLGASSDCHPGDAHFFDKSYYIGSKTEADIKEIRQELEKLADNDVVHVLTIDDIFPDN